MKNKFPMLLEPYRLPNGVLLKNRMESAPSTLYFLQGTEGGPALAQLVNHANRAKGGAGIVTIMGPTPTPDHDTPPDDPIMSHYTHSFDCFNTRVQNNVAMMVDAVHCFGSKALARFDIDGLIAQYGDYDVSDGLESSWVEGNNSKPRYDLKAAPIEVMEAAAERYAEAMYACKREMGFDGAWIHMAYRFVFLGRCLSPLTNTRTDKYGGSLEKRFAFPLLVARKIKEKCGKSFIIEASISGHDPDGQGATLEDACSFAKAAEGLIDILMIKAPEIDIAHPTQFDTETPWLYMAEAIKKAAPNVAISASGGFFDPNVCEQALETGKADMIAMARSFISNPNYGQLVSEGRLEDITPCLRCNKCHISSYADPWISVCSVNPEIGMEHMLDQFIKPSPKACKVAVIGGGPAGMEAALVAARRGHTVTLYEKEQVLGGQLNVTTGVDIKWTLQAFKAYLIRQVEKAAIRVVLGQAPTAEELEAEHFDHVIAAVGAVPAIPPIPGADGGQVISVEDAFQKAASLPEDVAIIGGGEIGTELGIYLARQGKRVSVLEMRGALSEDSAPMHYRKMFREVWESCKTLRPIVDATATKIDEGGVHYRLKDGGEGFVRAGCIVISAGMKPREAEALQYTRAGANFYMIGDCQKPSNVQRAMRSAYMTATRF